MNIKIFVTGGTFDKEYNELNGELFFKDTHIHEMLSLVRSHLQENVEALMMIDSLDMTEEQRKQIASKVKETSEKHIVITHGSDTMVETANVIAKTVSNKTVVLTGAMVPYKFGSSDGLFNLGTALAFAQSLQPGVYIAMNGRYFTHDNCRKNKQQGIFEEIEQS